MLKLKQTLPLFAAALFLTAFSATANAQNPVLTPADNGPCTDKWINYAYRTELRRAPVGRAGGGECNIYLYKAGSWNNYTELKNAVRGWDNVRRQSGIDIRTVGAVYKLFKSNRQVEAQLKAVAGTVTRIFDIMAQKLAEFRTGGYNLLDANSEKINLGNGSTVLISR